LRVSSGSRSNLKNCREKDLSPLIKAVKIEGILVILLMLEMRMLFLEE